MVLARPQLARSQFVFTQVRGRPAIFWQTQKAARASNPGARIPRARALDAEPSVAIDTRERYPFRFAGKAAQTERVALAAGDYGVRAGGVLIASVERKTFDNFATSLSDGTLAFQCQRLAELPAAAVVVEGWYSDLFRLEHVSGAWLADILVLACPRLLSDVEVCEAQEAAHPVWQGAVVDACDDDERAGEPFLLGRHRRPIGNREELSYAAGFHSTARAAGSSVRVRSP